MANEELKSYAKRHRIPQWKIADALQIHEVVLSRKLRYELSTEDQTKIRGIIDMLAEKEKD